MNVSPKHAFNQLHDHSAVLYSVVYFVDDGQGIAEAGSAACAGELLLLTQLKAWTDEFAYLSVAPVPGRLWLFPGYMPHAVLPRADGADESLRISVACNVAAYPSQSKHPLPTVWQASRMA